MSAKLIAMGALALSFGATSYYAGNQYLDNQTQARLSEYEKNLPKVEAKSVELTTIVVADARLGFGEQLTKDNLKVVEWPAKQVLEGSFTSLDELTGEVPRRALASIETGEPILKQKVTGENARAGLAGIIAPGMRAVTISVNVVSGVGGFVQPGDRVDIVLTTNGSREGQSRTSIIMQNVKVLSIDQETAERFENAKVAKSVTLETDAKGAQKITYARSIGNMSLLLRGQGDDQTASFSELGKDPKPAPNQGQQDSDRRLQKTAEAPKIESSSSGLFDINEKPKSKTIRVTNRNAVTSVTVPVEDQMKK